MDIIYPFIITFIIVFVSELGDKTQLLVISFATKDKARNILLGVAIGTFFSHGLAILFGSKLGSIENVSFTFYTKVFTYSTFLLFGIIGFIPKKENRNTFSFFRKISSLKFSYIFIVAFNIMIGEIGDKTFLASLGLGVQYPNYKISLILGSICGMVASNSISLFFGKMLGNKLNQNFIEMLSNIIFIAFGLIGFISIF